MITTLLSLLLLAADPVRPASATAAELEPIIQMLSRGQISQALTRLEPLARRYPDDPYVLGYLGRARLHAGDAQGAIKPLTKSLIRLPHDGEGHNNLGVAYMQLERVDAAVMSFARAVVKSPRSPQMVRNLAGAYTRLDRRKEAQDSWRRYLLLKPEDGEAQCVYGGLLLDADQPRQAAAALRRGSRLQPKDAVCLHDYADALGRLGQAGEALSILGRVVRINPKDAHAHYLRAYYLMEEEGALTQAMASLEQAIRLRPKAAAHHHLHGYLLSRLGRAQESLKAHARARDLEPKRQDYLEAYILAQVRVGQGLKVRSKLIRLNKKKPKNREVARALAEIYVNETRFARAEAILKKGGFKDLSVRKDLIWLYNEWNQPERALELLDLSQKDHPEDSSLYYNRALVLGRMGRLEGALKASRQAQELSPNGSDERQLYARLLLENGQAQKALGLLKKGERVFRDQVLRSRALRQALRLPDALVEVQGARKLAQGPEQDQEARRLHGKILTDLGRGAEAVGLFRGQGIPASELGIALSRAGRAKEALQVLQRAQYKEGRDPELSLAMASAYVQVGRSDQASGILQKARKRWPAHGGILNDFALLVLQKGQRKRAKKLLLLGLKSDPSREGLVRNLVALLIEEKRPEEAIVVARRALKHAQALGRIHTSLGEALEASGKPRQAWAAYKAALAAGTPDVRARVSMGDLERQAGRLLEAIKHYKAALEVSPSLVRAYNGLGLAYHGLERWKPARDWYRRGLKQAPKDPELNNNLGSALFLGGRPRLALKRFHNARRADPGEALYWRNEAMALKHLERLDDCEALLKQGLVNHPNDRGLSQALKALAEARQIKKFLRKD